jgi:Ca2+-binding EF-hand superfamily protein
MVASISSNTGSVSNWADSVFSKLDTKNQGYIEKSDLQSALSATGDSDSTQSTDIDDAFSALDGDGDGKVTKSELTDAMTKLSDQLSAQFDAARVNRGAGMRPDGPPPGPPPGGSGGPGGGTDGAGATGGTSGTSSTSSTSGTSGTTEAADTNGDGTVSAAELAAYETKQASESGSSSSGAGDGTPKTHHEHDPMRAFAHALQLLKAYADNSSDSGTTSSVSVEA